MFFQLDWFLSLGCQWGSDKECNYHFFDIVFNYMGLMLKIILEFIDFYKKRIGYIFIFIICGIFLSGNFFLLLFIFDTLGVVIWKSVTF